MAAELDLHAILRHTRVILCEIRQLRIYKHLSHLYFSDHPVLRMLLDLLERGLQLVQIQSVDSVHP